MKNIRKQTGKKKELYTKPDEFQSLTQRAMDYVKENTNKVLMALGVIAVVFIAAAGVMLWRENAKRNASAQIAEAVKYYDINSPVPGGKPMSGVERIQKARELFNKVAEKSVPGSGMALYYKANSEMELGNLDNAIILYKDLILRSSGNPSLVTLARHRLAEAYLAKGDSRNAIEILKAETASDKDYLKDAAHYKLAQIYQQAGRAQEAGNEINLLKKDFPDSQFTRELAASTAPAGSVTVAPAQAQPAAKADESKAKPAAAPVKK